MIHNRIYTLNDLADKFEHHFVKDEKLDADKRAIAQILVEELRGSATSIEEHVNWLTRYINNVKEGALN